MTYQLITLVGNVGRDPEIKYLRDGVAVTDFTLAVSKVTGRGETRRETSTWFKITVWRERAENAASLIKKGDRILVTGEVSASAFIDKKTGDARASLEVNCSEFRLLTSRADREKRGGGDEEGDNSGGGGNSASSTYGRRSKAEQEMLNDADEIPF